MSDFLSSLKVSAKSAHRPKFGVLYGYGGAGKTGLCLYAENPFYVSLEPGTDWINAPKFVDGEGRSIIPKNVNECFDMIKWLLSKDNRESLEQPVKTVVIDSVGFFETLNEIDVIEKNPTYGKEGKKTTCLGDLGYDGRGLAMNNWNRLLAAVDALQARGLDVIFICHAHRVNVTAENGEQYKEIDMALMNYGAYSVPDLLKRRADWVYYVSSEVNTIKRGEGRAQKTIALGKSAAEMAIYTRKTSLFYAKIRAQDEALIPDCYYLNADNRKEIATQLFNDIKRG